MKTDNYTKAILTVIAFALVGLLFKNNTQTVNAADSRMNKGYALVPVNTDGSVNVKLSPDTSPMAVNIKEINGMVIAKDVSSMDGSPVYYLPVKEKNRK